MENLKDYYLGLDIGTNSVGWAVTDEKYNILKKKRKFLYGVRLFEEAKTQLDRRVFRSNRRRKNRKKERINILKELFYNEITKIDKDFFERQEDSFYYVEHKRVKQKNTLFNDEKFKDKDFHIKYPTIYHLRKELMDDVSYHDPRFVYLAIKHIIENRGHFLFENLKLEELGDINKVFENFELFLSENMEIDLSYNNKDEFINILKDKEIKRVDKNKILQGKLKNSKEELKILGEIFKMMLGLTSNLYEIFENEQIKESKIKLSFEDSNYEEKYNNLSTILGDDIELVDNAKAIYDWIILTNILKSKDDEKMSTISESKCNLFLEYHKDLKKVKYLIDKYLNDKYYEIFNSEKHKDKIYELKLNDLEVEDKDLELLEELKTKISENRLLETPRSGFNSVLPMQVHAFELNKILENTSKYLMLLNEKDENGIKVSEKIKMLHEYRIPYYIGPLNRKSNFSWVERKKEGKVYPWNFQEMIDEEASSEKFILRMVRKCTYLPQENCLPKESLLYQKFEVLNQLNGLKINGEKIDNKVKKELFIEVFGKKNKVTLKNIVKYLINNNICNENDSIEGIDEVTTSLKTYIKMKNILGDMLDTDFGQELAENVIFWATIHNNKFMIKKIIEKYYKDKLSEDLIDKLSNLKFKDWGRLSRKFLLEVEHAGFDTNGEYINIIDKLWNDNKVMMELLSNKYTYLESLDEMREKKVYDKFDYNLIMDELFLSPSVKRTVWQTLKIIKELEKVLGDAPKKIFVEVTKNSEINKTKKNSRKKQIEDIYKAIKVIDDDVKKMKSELKTFDAKEFKIKKLFLYFRQMGRCMYSGENIPLSDLFNDNMYDIDHIYPRSLTKDDSFNNLVLVKKELNHEKSATYPLEKNIRGKMISFWTKLKEYNLISSEKFKRLASSNELTEEELSKFIARQLVETSQSIKNSVEVLKVLCPKTEFIFVKAQIAADFRKEYEYYKLRDLNNNHHAHDAYLNIMLGDIYNIKFTNNPMLRLKEIKKEDKEDMKHSKYGYNLVKMFSKDVYYKGEIIWKKDECLKKVEKYLYKEKPMVTKFSKKETGAISNQQLIRAKDIKKGSIYLPIKNNDKLIDIEKYGAFTQIKGSYFFLVEHNVKGEFIRTIEFVPIYLSNNIKTKEDLLNYCLEELKLIEPRILIDVIKKETEFKINGCYYRLTGRTSDNLQFRLNIPLNLSKESTVYLKYISREKIDEEKVTKEKNYEFFKLIKNKIENTIFRYRFKTIEYKKEFFRCFDNTLEVFKEKPINEQIKIINDTLTFFSNILPEVNLSGIGLKARSMAITFNKNISRLDEVMLINRSITGLYVNEVDLKKI